MRKAALALLCLALALGPLAAPAGADPQRSPEAVTVSEIICGDTLAVMRGGERLLVRLYGVDSPEYDEGFGHEAVKAMKTILDVGDVIELREMDKDKYGRVVAWVYRGGKNVNKEMVRLGAAWTYKQYCLDHNACRELKKMEAEARDNRRGLWDINAITPPWEWRLK